MRNREKGNGNKQQKAKQREQRLMAIGGGLLCAAAFGIGSLTVLGVSGKYNLERHTENYAAETMQSVQNIPVMSVKTEEQQKGQIGYEGHNYRYNDDILTFLFMGIEKESNGEPVKEAQNGGRAAALFLLVLNSHQQTITVLPVNCGTMIDIDVYDEQGIREGMITAPVAIQHQFGDGGKKSCEYQVKAVSRLFYGIPVHGYLAVDMDGVLTVSDMLGGMDLNVLKDIRAGKRSPLEEFVNRAREMTKKDISLLIKIFNKISDRAVTDITVDEMAYVAVNTGGYHFDAGRIIAVPGKSIGQADNAGGGDDEFYADESALYQLVLDIFYEPAD
ncbi:MAG TPA: hypothetical protein DCZ40_11450 [Lachnospiraceae bacterium]|nr:hypothetical protein [Lachnospiraceae bacterium]